MKKTLLSSLIITAAIALLFAGCKKADVTATTAQLSFAMASDNPLTTIATANTGAPGSGMTVFAATGQSIAWTSATANISQFKFEAKKDGTPIEILSSGLLNVDLLAPLPTTINTTIANGKYTNVEVRVVLAKQTGTGALPFVLKGTYTTSGGTKTVPVEFDFNDDLELKASANDITIDGKSDLLAKLSLHLSQLFSNITAQEIDQTTRTTINGVSTILITSVINPTQYNKIKADLLLAGGSNVTATPKK